MRYLVPILALCLVGSLLFREYGSAVDAQRAVDRESIDRVLSGSVMDESLTDLREGDGTPRDLALSEAWETHSAGPMLLKVVSATGMAIPGAVVEVAGPSGTVPIARTSANGTARVDADALSPGEEFLVSAPSFANRFAHPNEAVEGELLVELSDGGRVTGQVVLAAGEPAEPGLAVLAIPLEDFSDQILSAPGALRARHGSSGETDAEGCFAIDGLVDGTPYRLEVVSKTSVVFAGDERANVRAGDVDALVVLYPLYGVMLEFTCDDADHFKTFWRDPAPRYKRPPHLPLERADRIGPALAGFRTTVPTKGPTSEPFVCVLLAHDDSGSKLIEYELDLPGFKTVRTEFLLHPIGPDGLHVHAIDLVPSARGAGAVEFRLTSPAGDTSLPSELHADLDLMAEDGQALRVPVRWDAGASTARVEPLSPGRYTWSLQGRYGSFLLDGSEHGSLIVEDGGTTALDVPLPPLGYIEVHCCDERGDSVPSAIQLARGPGFSAGRAKWYLGFACDESPERLGPFPPDLYEILVLEPRRLPEGAHALELAGGQTHAEFLVLPTE